MRLTISDDLLQGTEISEKQAMLDLAIGLFIDQQVTLGRAARIAAMSQKAFLQKLGEKKIPIHYDADDLKRDVALARKLHV